MKNNLVKISELPNDKRNCSSLEHNPPKMIVLENGIYEYTCPKCGKKQTFTINKPTF